LRHAPLRGHAETEGIVDETQLRSIAEPSGGREPAAGAEPRPKAVDHWLETLPEGSAKIGRFTVLERVGAGGMGVVYAAYDTELDRKLAIKLLRDGVASTTIHARILREARAMAKLSHPNVAQIFEAGEYLGSTFIAMEFVPGTTLRAWQQAERRTWQEVSPCTCRPAGGSRRRTPRGWCTATSSPNRG